MTKGHWLLSHIDSDSDIFSCSTTLWILSILNEFPYPSDSSFTLTILNQGFYPIHNLVCKQLEMLFFLYFNSFHQSWVFWKEFLFTLFKLLSSLSFYQIIYLKNIVSFLVQQGGWRCTKVRWVLRIFIFHI